MKKIIFLLIIFGLSSNISFASSQNIVNLYEKKIERKQTKVDELSAYTMKYGIIKDVKYYEKLLEKYEVIVEREEAKVELFEALKDCKKGGETCIFQNYHTDTLTLEELYNLISKADDKKDDAEHKLEKLQKTVDYLHESQKEIEEREKREGKKNPFELEQSNLVSSGKSEQQKTGTIHKSEKHGTSKKHKEKENSKEYQTNVFKNKITQKLESLTEKYSKKQKQKIFKIILKKLKNYHQNKNIKILIEVLQEKSKN